MSGKKLKKGVIKLQKVIRLFDTDAAGSLFFGNYFRFAQEALEILLDQVGFSIRDQVRDKGVLTPVVHAEADYRKPLQIGDAIEVHLSIEKIGDSSFTIYSQIYTDGGKLAGTARTVHVTTDKKSRKAVSLPEELRNQLTLFQARQS